MKSSVDEEEQRWREALSVSKMECELLELKIAKLESKVSTLTTETKPYKSFKWIVSAI